MWAAGLLDEVRKLAGRGLTASPTAAKALGYAQALACLDGRLSAVEAQAETAQKTRRFARKQLAWWRRDPRIVWLAALPAPDPAAVAERLGPAAGGTAGFGPAAEGGGNGPAAGGSG
jgi:tRNA dimethylallyltransferase